jgi:hypothetical protein
MTPARYLSSSIKADAVIYADGLPPYREEKLFDYLSLTPAIEEKINTFYREHQMQDGCIGIHIRNTDMRPSRDINDFLTLFCRYLSESKRQKVFLSTDSKEVEELFQRRIADLIVYPKQLIAGNEAGLHFVRGAEKKGLLETQLAESIIDIWLLSKCSQFFFQEMSTFSRIALFLKENKNCINWMKWQL